LIYAAKTPLLAGNLCVFQIGVDAWRMHLHRLEFSDSHVFANRQFFVQQAPKESLPTLKTTISFDETHIQFEKLYLILIDLERLIYAPKTPLLAFDIRVFKIGGDA
jgi:hypothetical protein